MCIYEIVAVFQKQKAMAVLPKQRGYGPDLGYFEVPRMVYLGRSGADSTAYFFTVLLLRN